MKIERNLLLDYQAACKMLPNVKPRVVSNILNSLLDRVRSQVDILHMTADTPEPTIEYCGITLSLSDIHSIRDTPDFGRIKTPPQGARILISLYQAGGLFSERDKKSQGRSCP